MDDVTLTVLSREPHVSQILTGFTLLERQKKLRLKIEWESAPAFPFVAVQAQYRGKTLIYDVMDGYQEIEAIRYYAEHCDHYFKRSFSPAKNEHFGLTENISPLGFNYHVSCHGHPLDKPFWKEEVKRLLGIEHNMFCCSYYTPAKFEQAPKHCRVPQVLFLTRLWDESPNLPPDILAERKYINQSRIEIIRQLKSAGELFHFAGGLADTAIARSMAPDLIMPYQLTDRRNYLKCLSKSNICIGTMGLHESIGWKTGEYVAAAKAIVNETFHYEVPGPFNSWENYIPFETAQQCITAVKSLAQDPEKIYQMSYCNAQYYRNYLRPDVLIANTLAIVDSNFHII